MSRIMLPPMKMTAISKAARRAAIIILNHKGVLDINLTSF